MSVAHGRLFGAIAMAAMFVGAIVLSVEKGISFLQMSAGFWIVGITGFVLVNLRSAATYFGATVVLLLGGYAAYKLGWPGVRWGAGAAAIANVLLWFLWVRPNTSTPFQVDDYARQQAQIRRDEEARRAGQGPAGKA